MLDRSECMLGLFAKTCRKATLIPKIRQENNIKTVLKKNHKHVLSEQ
jgi:hypothetical protein